MREFSLSAPTNELNPEIIRNVKAWIVRAQCTEVKLRQSLMMSECLPEHV